MLRSQREISIEEDNLSVEKYLQSRDPQYWGTLYEKYRQPTFLLCMRIVRNVEEAKDLAAETFIKAFEHLERFKPGHPFLPWLSRIATNLCVDHLRRRNRFRFQAVAENHVVANSDGESSAEDQEELKTRILKAIKMLKRAQRRCFCLFYIHRLSYQEISELTGYSLQQVRSHIQNGRRKFKICMEQK